MQYVKFHSDRGFHEIHFTPAERKTYLLTLAMYGAAIGKYRSDPSAGIAFIHDRNAIAVNKALGENLIPVQGPGFAA